MGIINSIKENLLDFLFPKICLICSEKISEEDKFTYLCSDCLYNLPAAPSSDEIINRLLEGFNADDIGISNIYSLFTLKNNEFLQVIHSLKYEEIYQIGYEFGKELGWKIKSHTEVSYDAIIPVPIHSAKKRERGYNQSTYIAKGIAEILNVSVDEKIIARNRYTKSQTTLNSHQRKANISDVYETLIDSSLIKNKTYLIVDDVFTTGSTINFLAMKLLESGARKIDCSTLGVA